MPSNHRSQSDASDRHLDRRSVLAAAGAATAGGFALVGTASAHETSGKPVFCGCSQVCACGSGSASVLVAVEDDGFQFEWVEDVPFNFCVSIDDPDVPDGKIIAVQVAGTRWTNPNNCAQRALAVEREVLDSDHPRPEGESGGPCGQPPCEHPSRRNGNGNENGNKDENGNGNGN